MKPNECGGLQISNPYEGAFDLQWFKGDLHIHSSVSDGKADLSEIKSRLRACGFDFAALADHDQYQPGGDHHDPVLLGNGEFRPSGEGDILALGVEITMQDQTMQEIIDEVNEAGGFPVLAHPKIGEFRKEKVRWSLTCSNLFNDLEGYRGMEVYTHNIGSGFQLAIDRLDAVWTYSCGSGLHPVAVWGLATSDAHDLEAITPDVGIMVAAEECSSASLLSAIKKGRFYALAASSARFLNISRRGQRLHFAVEGAELIQLYGMPQKLANGDRRRLAIEWANGKDCIELDYELAGTEGFVRAEAMDKNGNYIVSNPIEIISPSLER